jgi:NAD(P)-dependent dehydrogenase (short-subunit alcohol dehydrogenase family)
VAIAYAREGADVVINYLPEEEPDAEDVVAVINSTTDSRIFTIPGDLRNRDFCIDLASRAADLLGGLDILVNNAAFSNISFDITTLPEHSFQRTIQTNIMAPFWLTQAARPLLSAGASIIFTSSGIGEQPAAELLDYAGTRAFISNFVRGLSRQLTPQGIRVNGVLPALTLSPFLPQQGLNTSAMNYIIQASPMGRIEMPVELSPLFVNLAENAASFVSGGLWTAAGGQG